MPCIIIAKPNETTIFVHKWQKQTKKKSTSYLLTTTNLIMPCIILAKPNETTIDVSYSKIRPKSGATLEMFFPELKKNCILSVFAVFVTKVVLTISIKRIKRHRKSLIPIMRLINLILLSKPASYVISNHVAKKKEKKREIKVINEKKKKYLKMLNILHACVL